MNVKTIGANRERPRRVNTRVVTNVFNSYPKNAFKLAFWQGCAHERRILSGFAAFGVHPLGLIITHIFFGLA